MIDATGEVSSEHVCELDCILVRIIVLTEVKTEHILRLKVVLVAVGLELLL